MGRQTSAKSSERSIIPLLFTLGIIGWGFFAIARMTENSVTITPRRVSKSDKTSTPLSSFKQWLLERLTQTQKDKTTPEITLKTLAPPVLPSEELPVIEDPLVEKLPLEEAAASTKPATLTGYVKVYLYALDKQGNPQLKSVQREISGADPRLMALQASIQGPSAAEEMRNFIDSFPTKPKILSLEEKGDVLVINFSENFGIGVSHATLKYQIQQLLHTALQFDGIQAISIKVNGKATKHLGGDGIAVPERIDIASLKTF